MAPRGWAPASVMAVAMVALQAMASMATKSGRSGHVSRTLAVNQAENMAPCRDIAVVVAIGAHAAHHQQQHLRQGVRHFPRLTRVLDHLKTLKKRAQAQFLAKGQGGQGHGASPNLGDSENHGRGKP